MIYHTIQHQLTINVDDSNGRWITTNAKNCGLTMEKYLSDVAQHKYQRLRYDTTMHDLAIHIYNLNRNMSPFMPLIDALAEQINTIADQYDLNPQRILICVNVERQLIYIYGEKATFNIIESTLQQQYHIAIQHVKQLFHDAKQQNIPTKDLPLQPFEAFCHRLLHVYHWQCHVSYKKNSDWAKKGC